MLSRTRSARWALLAERLAWTRGLELAQCTDPGMGWGRVMRGASVLGATILGAWALIALVAMQVPGRDGQAQV